MENNRPKVGMGVIVLKDGKILLGKRKSAHGKGQYCTPGGHMEYMESFEGCIKREVKEETGIEIQNVTFLCVINLKVYAPKHYVDIHLRADWKAGEPKVMEPDKCESWGWYSLDNLPKPLFGTELLKIEALKTGKKYFDN